MQKKEYNLHMEEMKRKMIRLTEKQGLEVITGTIHFLNNDVFDYIKLLNSVENALSRKKIDVRGNYN